MTNPNTFDPNALERAMMLQQAGKVAEAAAAYRQLLRQAPSNPQLLYLLGIAEMQMGNLREGAEFIGRSLEIAPGQPRAHCNLGVALYGLGRHAEALESYGRAIALNPNYAMAHNNRGTTLLEMGRHAEALDAFGRAVAIEPRYAEAHNNRGGVLRHAGDLEEALKSFDRAIALRPDYAVAHLNRATVLNELCRPDEALASFDRAIVLDGSVAAAHCGRAAALFSLKRLDEAEMSNDRALALAPDFAEAHWNRALSKLVAGDLAPGWELYEWRRKLEDWRRNAPYAADDARRPLWTGSESIEGKTLLVRFEQGFGDFIQFCRYLPMVRAMGARVIVEARNRLLPLLGTLEGDFVFIETGGALPDFDLICPIMSLPRAFKTTLETIPATVPYLFADRDRQERTEARLGARTAPRIGLAWSGNPKQPADRVRSMPLRRLEPLLRLPFDFHGLQLNISSEDAAMMERFQTRSHRDEQNDLADAAALVAAMDLVITVDTVIAHVAGAMAKPVWIMLPFMADWRWLLDRTDSPWYATARLFRQPARGDWDGVVRDILDRLENEPPFRN